MSFFHRIFNVVSTLATGVMIFNKLRQVSQAKDEIYSQLPPDLQAQWVKAFGDPSQMQVSTPNPISISTPQSISQAAPVAKAAPSQVSQVAAGI